MNEKKAAPKFQAPKGYTRQSSNAVGFWADDGSSAILFVPKGVKLMDGTAKGGGKEKPSMMLVGELKAAVMLQNKDELFEGSIGDIVGVYYKPGMGREMAIAYGVETWIAPLYDESTGERVTQNTGKGQPMKLYDVRFSKKLEGKRVPVLEDTRVESRHKKTIFDDPAFAGVRAKAAKDAGVTEDDVSDADDSDLPY